MKEETVTFLLVGGLVLFIGIIAISQPYFEAKEFNRCTGGHATYFTALTTELRVQDCK